MIGFLWLSARGYEFKGQVVDSENREALPYALVYLSDDIHTYTDENGMFHFQVPDSLSHLKAKVSYTSRKTTVIDGYANSGRHQLISLEPAYKNLKTVYIQPGKFKTKIYGKKNGKGLALASLSFDDNERRYSDMSGKYKGMIQSYFIMAMEVDTDKDTYLDAVGLYAVNFPDFLDNSVIRVNIYDIGNCNRGKKTMPLSCAKEWLRDPLTFRYSWTHVYDGKWEKSVDDPMLLPRHALVEFQLLLPADYVNRDDWVYKSGMRKGGRRWDRHLKSPDVWKRSTSEFEIPFFIRCSEKK